MVTQRKSPKLAKQRELPRARDYCIPRPILRTQRTYSSRRKQEVLLFLLDHRIPMRTNDVNEYLRPSRILKGMPDFEEEVYRRPKLLEATEYFRIARESTIHTWWKNRHKIFGKRSVFSACSPKWPALEKTLVEHFIAAKRENKIVTVHWFWRMAQKIWQSYYPKLADVFVFSNGWFWRFLRRHGIVRRRITKVATKPPEEVMKVLNCFIQYIRRNNRREDDWAAVILRSSPPAGKPNSLGRFPNHLIINLDETPLPFEFLNGYSYDFKRATTVAGRSERSGWDKRQATISSILWLMAAHHSSP
jgi:hypothetical protein